MKEYFSLILIFLLPVLQLLIIQRCITTLLGSGNRKPIGMISWLLYYVFLVTTGVEDLFPPQFLLVGNILMVFMISTVTRKRGLKRDCISTLLICTVWMVVEVIALLILEAAGMDECVIDVAGSFISKMCMLLFSVLLDRYTKEKQYAEISPAIFYYSPSGAGKQYLYDAPHLSYSGIAFGIFLFSRLLQAYFFCW